MVLFISYDRMDASRSGQFDALDAAIKANSNANLRTAYSQWLVDTNEDVAAWGTRLESIFEAQDRAMIVRVNNAASVNGWLPKANWDWIAEHAT